MCHMVKLVSHDTGRWNYYSDFDDDNDGDDDDKTKVIFLEKITLHF